MHKINFTDITANLPSVQFESALSKEQLTENHLRNKSHGLLFFACAQSLYFVNTLNEFRENRLLVLHPNDKKLSNRLLKDLQAKEPLLVGVIGFGRLGSRLAGFLVRGSGLLPQEVKISTRRPEAASELAKLGAICTFDNSRVASSVHLLFLCCPPAAVPHVADEIRDHLSPRTIVYSFVSGFKEKKLRQLLDHDTIVCPEFESRAELSDTWPCNADMRDLLGRQEAAAACPVPQAAQHFIRTSPKLFTQWVYAIANLCTRKGHTVEESLRIVNHIFVRSVIRQKSLRQQEEQEEEEEEEEEEEKAGDLQIQLEDLIRGLEEDDKILPIFDMTEISLQVTYFDQRLQSDPDLSSVMSDRFCQRLRAACTKLKFHEAA